MRRRPEQLEPKNRVLPHNLDAEASILGGVLLHNDVLTQLDSIEVEDFYDLKHRVVFQAIRNLEASARPIDVVTLENEIAKVGKLDAIGGVAFLGELTLRVPTVDNVLAYAEIVVTKRITRQVMVLLSQLIDEAYVGETEGDQLVHDVTSAMLTVRTGDESPILTVAELIAREATRVTADVSARLAGKQVFAGVPTGITAIDNLVGGTPVGIPTLVIARPGAGKTTIAQTFAAASRRIAGWDSLLVSYEDGGDSFGLRGLGQVSGLDTQLMRARKLTPDDLITIAAAEAAAADRTEGVLVASGMSVEALVRRVRRANVQRRMQGQAPYKQVIVDYIQRMPMPQWAKTQDQGLGYISGTLATMAVKEEIALVVCSQLNRESEKRDDHRPRLSDIRESGALEQDAKFVLGLYRPWMYQDVSSDEARHPQIRHGAKVKAEPEELHVLGLKNHQGEIFFDICLFWDVKTNTVYNSVLEYQEERAKRERALERLRAQRRTT